MNLIPSGWTNDRLKDVSAINASSLPTNTNADYEFDYLEISNVNYFGVVDPEQIERLRYEDAPSRARRRIAPNSTIISSVRPNLQAVAFIPDAGADLVCSTGFNVVQPHETRLLPRFSYFALISESARQYFEAAATGVGYPAVGDKEFNSFPLPLPPLPEQQRIAAYLDASCAAIDAAVTAKRRQLETLDNLRWAISLKAVTQGLNPNVAMRRTGVDWVPEIPAHWEVSKLNTMFRFRKGDKAMELTQKYIAEYPGEFPVYSGQTADEGLMGSIDSFEFDFASPVIFVTTVGAKAMTTRIVSGKFSLSQNCALIIPWHRGVNVDYYYPAIHSLFDFERRSIALIMQPSLRFKDLKKFRLPVPPRDEQREIVAFLKGKSESIASVIAGIESQIDTLTAYRKSLIHECVTGQRRVTEEDFNRVKGHG